MLCNAKGGKVIIGDTDRHYVIFGKGQKNLVIILGLGDGLKTVKGQAITLAIFIKNMSQIRF